MTLRKLTPEREPVDGPIKILVIIYFALLLICLLFDVRVGTSESEIQLASPGGAALLALFLFGVLMIVSAWREPDVRKRRVVLVGALCIGVPVCILVCVHVGGAWAWAGGGLAAIICLVMGGLQKGWSLRGSIAVCFSLLGAMVLVAILSSGDTMHHPTPDQIQRAKKAFER